MRLFSSQQRGSAMTTTYDFSAPVFASRHEKERMARSGWHWRGPGDVDLSDYYGAAASFYLAKSERADSARVYIDGGVILEFRSRSADNYESFGLHVALPPGLHDNTIYL